MTIEAPNIINWRIQHMNNDNAHKYIMAANFQDIFQLTRRVGEVRLQMDKIRFRAQGIGGMLGIAGGALGGPLGSVVGFGVGRSIGGYIGNVMAKRYYGQDHAVINEQLTTAQQRNSQLNYQYAVHNALGEVLDTLAQNEGKEQEKIIQDVLVL
jgi:uncharacterized protein YcfJ